ncbi:NADH dehydrogenase subunit M [Methylobacter tundripaludum]|uniref:NADH-quinone oxidoreductase subunit M n=1 Tax=Methylobacter tundripaludum TaxID=173365 RepID=A0A2S6HDN1_9GAMM|nr:NADH-quinone oxidoreductase subunit M [Methylobacter tundripaludum]PPK75546.1 NADH dehydrogenase subunit M [Methylobacter tundripaludum]
MILPMLIGVLLLGGFAAWFSERWSPIAPRWVAIVTLAVEALLLVLPYAVAEHVDGLSSAWFADFYGPWIPRFGISFHLAMDGLSLLLITLTVLLGFMAVSSSWTEIKNRQGFFFFNLLACLAGTVGVFLAVDLFLFFFFWELMITPMYFLISIWGHENRTDAAIKFFIFTQVSGLLMLLAIITLVLLHYNYTGIYSFDYFELLNTVLEPHVAFWLMLGFFIAFTVKLPMVPFHTWLPDAHTQAPTGGSVILAGVMLKTGAYGLLRFVIPLFPDAAHQFAPIAMTLGAVSVLYAAIMAFAQSDLKRLIAYTSVSHMGFILLGVFSWNLLALQGSVITMLAHGISASALFMIAGALQERLHTREMGNMGGLWPALPRLSALALFFAVASLGLPGLGNFMGEFLVLQGAFSVNMLLVSVATLVLILAPVYALIMIQKAFYGPPSQHPPLPDVGRREWASLGLLVLASAWLGLSPQAVLDVSVPVLKQAMQNSMVMER